jgi:hypothetical protein
VNLGAPELLIIGGTVLPLVVIVWGIADAASRPAAAWVGAGESKTLWLVLQALGILFCLAGLVLSLVYLLVVRPKVARAQAGVA